MRYLKKMYESIDNDYIFKEIDYLESRDLEYVSVIFENEYKTIYSNDNYNLIYGTVMEQGKMENQLVIVSDDDICYLKYQLPESFTIYNGKNEDLVDKQFKNYKDIIDALNSFVGKTFNEIKQTKHYKDYLKREKINDFNL